MNSRKLSSSQNTTWLSFLIVIAMILGAYLTYGANLVMWRNAPEFGFRLIYASGPNLITEVFENGRTAGLRVGDRIHAINGQPYSTFEELNLKVRNKEPGAVNTYSIIRDGRTLDIAIINKKLGIKAVLSRSLPFFLIGSVYIVIGILVFLMKPRDRVSFIFLVLTGFLGTFVSFAAPSSLLKPLWFYNIQQLLELVLPASLIHLSLRFPRTRMFLKKRPWMWVLPYLLSIFMFILYNITSTSYWDSPKILNTISTLYTFSGVIVFMSSMIWNILKDHSNVIRLQSQVILIGIILGFLIPKVELLLRFFWGIHVFPDPGIGFAVFLSIFPLSIGYTIVKHDLFAIDVIVRRTYGYVLSTATIIAVYSAIVSLLNVTFHDSDIYRSPIFSITFALAVVFLFRPVHERFQNFIDRLFYRQKYDYRKTIKDISKAITSIFDPEKIHNTLIGSIVKEMFLENGLLLLPDPAGQVFDVRVAKSDNPGKFNSKKIADGSALLKAIKKKKNAIFRTEVDLNPRYEPERETLQNEFESFESELMLPMKYKDEIVGILSLGGKKSGKMYTPEDLDLLKTLTNQSAIALENAKLFRENLEKGRMEEELNIAHDLQVSMLPEAAPVIEGFSIAADSIAAREVGGDFFDFIEIKGEGTDDKLGIVVADVSGKAVSGALVMAASRSVFRVLSETHSSVEDIMKKGNTRLKSDVKKGMFVALLYAVLDPVRKTVTLSNAGQTQPVLCSGSSAPVYIDTEGDRFPLGIVKNCDYQETNLQLKQGDVIVLYTDGVVEAMDGNKEMYGFERFLKSIDEGRTLDANALLKKLYDDVSGFTHDVEQHDDITIVVVKVE